MRNDATSSTGTGAASVYVTRSTNLRANINISDNSTCTTTGGIVIGACSKNTWYKFVLKLNNGANTYDYEIYTSSGTLLYSATGITMSSIAVSYRDLLAYSSLANTGNSYWDNIFSRQYAATEPTVSLSSEEVGPGPIAHWKFDEGSDNTCPTSTADACDSSGNDWDLYRNGNASWVTEDMCVSGSCAYFDGDSDYFDNPDSMYLGERFTLSLWMKVPDIVGNHYIIESEYGEPLMFISGSTLRATLRNAADTAWVNYDAPSVITANEWQHVAVTYDNLTDDVVLYRNGLEVGSGSHPGPIAGYTSTQNLWIGGRATVWYEGFIDEVKIYPYARSAEQIKADYILGASASGSSVVLGTDDTNLSNGLVGYWKMDEGSANSCSGGVNDSCDSSGNGNDGAWNGAATSGSGKFGSGVVFNDGYINLGTSETLALQPTGFSISTWLKADNTINWKYIVQRRTASYATGYLLQLNYSTNRLCFVARSVNNTYCDTSAQLNDNQWHHVTVSYDGQTLKFYRAGQLTQEYAVDLSTVNITIPGGTTYLGDTNTFYSMEGSLDDLRIYNRALSETEVKALYQWAPGPVAYYNFDEKQGSTAYDKGTLGNNGTLENSPTWTEGKYGSALDFNQTDNRVLVDSNFGIGTNNLTISTWVYIPSTSEKGAFVKIGGAQVAGKDTNYTGYAIGVGNGALELTGNTLILLFEGVRTVNTGRTLGTGWHHVAMTVNEAGAPSAYLNGQFIASYPGTGPNAPVGNTKIGGYTTPNSTNRQFGGSVDDVRIYNYARTQSQIIEDMNAGHPTVGTPVGSTVLHMKFDEGYGSTAHDSSPEANNGTLGTGNSAPTWTNDGKFGKALSFDGNDYLAIPDDPSLKPTTQITISTWVKWTGGSGNWNHIVVKPSTTTWSGTYMNYGLRINNSGVFEFFVDSGADINKKLSGTVVYTPDSVWRHVAATYDGSQMILYVDGKIESSKSLSTSISTSTQPLAIGTRNTISPGESFNGQIDEVKVYPFALSADQIQTEYNSGKTQVLGAKGTESDGSTPSNSASREYCVPGDTGNCDAPVAEWKFDERTGTTANDTSGNGNTGTLGTATSAPSWSSGKYGAGLDFDGVNDYVSVPDASGLQFTGDLTIGAWFRTGSTDPNSRGIIRKDTISGTRYLYSLSVSNGTGVGKVSGEYYNGVNYLAESSTTFNDNKWHYAVMTISGTTLSLFVDGVIQDTVTIAGTRGAPNGQTGIGAYPPYAGGPTGFYYPFDGDIDHVRIYNYARTPAQIAWEYNRGAPIAWYKFDECQGTTAYNSALSADGTAAGNNGTIYPGDATGSNDSVGTCAGSTGEMWADGATGKINSSLEFDGTNDYVYTPDNPNLSERFSVSAWVYSSNYAPTMYVYEVVYGKPIMYVSGNDIRVSLRDSGDTTWNAYGPNLDNITNSAWHHLVATYDNPDLDLYVDGALVYSGTHTGPLGGVSTSLDQQIGGRSSVWFNGLIDDVRIYNYALTDQQIKQVYTNGSVSFK